MSNSRGGDFDFFIFKNWSSDRIRTYDPRFRKRCSANELRWPVRLFPVNPLTVDYLGFIPQLGQFSYHAAGVTVSRWITRLLFLLVGEYTAQIVFIDTHILLMAEIIRSALCPAPPPIITIRVPGSPIPSVGLTTL